LSINPIYFIIFAVYRREKKVSLILAQLLMRKILLILNAVLIFFTLMSYLSASTNPATTKIFYFIGLAYNWLLIFNLIFIGFWLLKKQRYWLYSLTVLLIGWGNLTKYWGLSLFDGNTKKQTIKVLTYNTNSFDYITKEKAEIPKRFADVNDFLKEEKPDIICFQEHASVHKVALEQAQTLPYLTNFYVVHPVEKALVMFSKYPVLNTGFLNFDTGNNDVIFADINVNGSLVRCYCVHLKSNSVSGRTTTLIQNKEFDKESATTSRSVLSQVKKQYSVRAGQAEKLKAHIASSPYPVIVCGDFNDTPQTYTYFSVAENLQDTWQEKGFGRGSTYDGAIPFLRIDYILASKNLDVIDCDVLRSANFSDHFPVSAVIGF
jgi:endonuclease/exonuclease/phosphatase family metal-dependent hydrolase